MHVCVCSVDSKLSFRSLLEGLGFTEDDLPAQMDSDKWVDKIPMWSSHVSLVSCSQTITCRALSLAV